MDSNLIGAVYAIPPYDRETWVRVAMALKSEFGDAGPRAVGFLVSPRRPPEAWLQRSCCQLDLEGNQAKGRRCHDRDALLSREATRLDWREASADYQIPRGDEEGI